MARIVLVHGAMHGGWCWEELVPFLVARGHVVSAPDFPGSHGELAPDEVTLGGYTNAVVAALEEGGEPALLVGHSLGGMAVSAAAEARPGAVRRLVYLCALLSLDGESAGDVLALNPDRSVIESFQFRPDGQAYELPPENRRAMLYHDCPDELTSLALGRLVPQSTRMMREPVRLGAGFAGVPKTYLETTADAALSIAYQRAMIARYSGIAVRTLPCAHSPFYACPEVLADMLDELARQDAPVPQEA